MTKTLAERRSPLESAQRALGAEFSLVRGCFVPAHFGDVGAEYRAVREGAGIIDRLDRTYLVARGADTRDFLHRILSNSIQELQPGQGAYSLLLTTQAHIVADLYALVREDHYLLETGWEFRERLGAALDNYIIADDVEVEDKSAELAALSIEGPAAAALLGAVGATELPQKELSHLTLEVGQTEVRVVRLSEAGGEGYRLIFPSEKAGTVWEALLSAQKHAPWKPVGHQALDVLRTEAGIPRLGVDIDDRTLPPEAGLEARAISYTKGCYPGQEIIERIRSRGHVNRKLTGLALAAESVPEPGTQLLKDGKTVGSTTTVLYSPGLKGLIGLGYVRREWLEPGTELQLPSGETVRVTGLPFPVH